MSTSFGDIPQRIFLDSSALQALQSYGGFLYESEPIATEDRVRSNPAGIANLEALRSIMRVAERAPFEFALSENSLSEVNAKQDPAYLRWAYDVLDHWEACLAESGNAPGSDRIAAQLAAKAFNYLGRGDRLLLKDALALGCDSFLTMETRLPKNRKHLERTTGIRVLSPIGMWELLSPWAALYC